MLNLIPPSLVLIPPAHTLRERLAIALQEVNLLRRLIRAAESFQPHPIPSANRLTPSAVPHPSEATHV
jgi:hypothetical protein